jgi:hypothetical protein
MFAGRTSPRAGKNGWLLSCLDIHRRTMFKDESTFFRNELNQVRQVFHWMKLCLIIFLLITIEKIRIIHTALIENICNI